MSFLRSKNRKRSLLYIRLAIGFCLLVSIALSFSVYERFRVERDMSLRRAEAEKELVDLQTRKDLLQSKVDYMSQDEGVEAAIRQHFDVAKQGEQVVVLVGEDEASEPLPLPNSDNPRPSFWSKWFSW